MLPSIQFQKLAMSHPTPTENCTHFSGCNSFLSWPDLLLTWFIIWFIIPPQKMNPCYLPNQTYSQRIRSLPEELKINKVFFSMRNLRPSFVSKQCSINRTRSSSVLYFHKIFDPSSLLLLNRDTLVQLHYKFLSGGKTNKQATTTTTNNLAKAFCRRNLTVLCRT